MKWPKIISQKNYLIICFFGFWGVWHQKNAIFPKKVPKWGVQKTLFLCSTFMAITTTATQYNIHRHDASGGRWGLDSTPLLRSGRGLPAHRIAHKLGPEVRVYPLLSRPSPLRMAQAVVFSSLIVSALGCLPIRFLNPMFFMNFAIRPESTSLVPMSAKLSPPDTFKS